MRKLVGKCEEVKLAGGVPEKLHSNGLRDLHKHSHASATGSSLLSRGWLTADHNMLAYRRWINILQAVITYRICINCPAEAEAVFRNNESDKEILDTMLIKSGYDKRTRPDCK
ncbi:hypothetical protein CEXT_527851 [Caerostris extrusa]|uniref:Uncharacterized protein n=1 Tax=Caerostris extrusa TaxID=172846 RepID=A0AAV4XSI6_CAEEX|nr:hypothetical protein CEXT_527851 [Caerostris extrusa]